MNEGTTKSSFVKDPRDLLAMTLGEFLQLLAAHRVDVDRWVDGRSCEIAYREGLAAIKRGELKASKVGRKLLVRRSELDRWIDSQRLTLQKETPSSITTSSPVAHILEAAGYRKSGA